MEHPHHQIQWAEAGSASPCSGSCQPSSCSQPQGWVEGTEDGSPLVTVPGCGRDPHPSCHKHDRASAGLWQIVRTLGAPTPRTVLPGPRYWAWAGNWQDWQRASWESGPAFLHLAQQHPATSWPSPSPGEQDTSPPALSPGQPTSTHLQVPGGPWQADWLGSGAIKGGEG